MTDIFEKISQIKNNVEADIDVEIDKRQKQIKELKDEVSKLRSFKKAFGPKKRRGRPRKKQS